MDIQPFGLVFRDSEPPLPIILNFRGPYRWASNFHRAEITLPADPAHDLPALTMPSTENYYMAWKVLNLSVRHQIAGMSPAEAKRFSNTPEFEAMHRSDYTPVTRVQAMLDATRLKYAPDHHPDLVESLLATGEAVLIEGNTWGDDLFGFALQHPPRQPGGRKLLAGWGHNALGQLLMVRRDELRVERGLDPIFAGFSPYFTGVH